MFSGTTTRRLHSAWSFSNSEFTIGTLKDLTRRRYSFTSQITNIAPAIQDQAVKTTMVMKRRSQDKQEHSDKDLQSHGGGFESYEANCLFHNDYRTSIVVSLLNYSFLICAIHSHRRGVSNICMRKIGFCQLVVIFLGVCRVSI